MDREGGEQTHCVTSYEVFEKLMKEHHETSQRQKVRTHLPGIFENKDAATKAVEEEKNRIERQCDNNYNVAVGATYYEQNEEVIDMEMEPDFENVEKAFSEIEKASELHFVKVDNSENKIFVKCNRCESTINAKILSKTPDMEGVCVLCANDNDMQFHTERPNFDFTYIDRYKYGGKTRQELLDQQDQHNARLRVEQDLKIERLGLMLKKIGKRPTVQNSAKKHLFNSLRYRPLFKQPQHSNAVAKFRNEVARLLPRRDEVEKKQQKLKIKYMLVISWCSNHDEWQEIPNMDEY